MKVPEIEKIQEVTEIPIKEAKIKPDAEVEMKSKMEMRGKFETQNRNT